MGPSLEKLVVALSGYTEAERSDAVEDLQQLKDREGIPYLVVALHDRSVRVREAAVRALIDLGGADVADAAAALLGSENVGMRNGAIEILEELGESALLPLERYLMSTSADVRKFSIDTVGKIISQIKATPSTLSLLVDRLWDSNENVAGAAAEALGGTRDDTAVSFLVDRISASCESSWLQCSIVAVLADIESAASMDALQQIRRMQLSAEAKTFLDSALSGAAL